MHPIFLFAANFFDRLWRTDLWYALPLVIAVSLVYAATRHEDMREILPHALRIGVWIGVVMSIIFLLLWFLSRGL
jgi:hypothetical protein